MRSLGSGLALLCIVIALTLYRVPDGFAKTILLLGQIISVIAILYRMVRGVPNRSE